MGIFSGDSGSDCLRNLRFADDVLLFSTSQVLCQKMMCDFKQSIERVGLKIHPDNTKILSDQISNRRKEMETNNIKVEILSACESAKYLGQTIFLSFSNRKQLRSTNESEPLGLRSSDTNKS